MSAKYHSDEHQLLAVFCKRISVFWLSCNFLLSSQLTTMFHQHFATLGQKPACTFVTYNNMRRRNKMIRNNLNGMMIKRQHTVENNHWERDALNFARQVFKSWSTLENVSSMWISCFSRNCGTTSVEEWKTNLVLSNELINVELPPWKIWKANVSRVSPLSEQIFKKSSNRLIKSSKWCEWA